MKKPEFKFDVFHNTSLGILNMNEVMEQVLNFIHNDPRCIYKLMIGSDSNGRDELDLVSVIAIHRSGKGGRYFWHRIIHPKVYNLHQKIWAETHASVQLALQFVPEFREKMRSHQENVKLEIHVDVGENGPTRELIQAVTGMVRAYGYEVLIKPESTAATTLADKHVRF